MVITKPFPNMPVGFWGPGGEQRYHEAYYEAFPQKKPAVWTHGDWVEVHSLTNGVTVFGRSDGVLNPAGVRFGSAEMYAPLPRIFLAAFQLLITDTYTTAHSYSVVEKIEEVEDCLAIGQKLHDGDERL